MKKIIYTIGFIGLFGCSTDSTNDLQSAPIPTLPLAQNVPITYTANIKSIIDTNCISCHNNPPVNGAPTNLTNYLNVKNASGTILERISKNTGESGAMPLGGQRLSQIQIDTFQKWINDGLIE